MKSFHFMVGRDWTGSWTLEFMDFKLHAILTKVMNINDFTVTVTSYLQQKLNKSLYIISHVLTLSLIFQKI